MNFSKSVLALGFILGFGINLGSVSASPPPLPSSNPPAYSDYDKGLLMGLRPALVAVSAHEGGRGDANYWMHHVSLKAHMAAQVARDVYDLTPRLTHPFLQNDLRQLAVELSQFDSSGSGDSNYWATREMHQRMHYDQVTQKFYNALSLHQAPNQVFTPMERGLLDGLRVAFRLLVTDGTNGKGDANYWMHHVNVRYSVAISIASELERLIYVTQNKAIQIMLRELAADIRGFNPSGKGDTDYWLTRELEQRRHYSQTTQRFERMVRDIEMSRCDDSISKG